MENQVEKPASENSLKLTPEGKWLVFNGDKTVPDSNYVAFQEGPNGNIVVFSKNGVNILAADQKGSLGHLTNKEIEQFVTKVKHGQT